jgi:tetratricopeptide (TPR) repeat protein
MKMVRSVPALCLLISLVGQVTAQVTLDRRIIQASELNSRGRSDEAINLLRPLLEPQASFSNPADVGTAWNVLALVYQGRGNYDAARRGYERSLAMLRQDSTMKLESASATDNLGSLYFEMHELGPSKSLRAKARNLYAEEGNHAGMARASGGLALIALTQEHRKEAHRNLDDAFGQIKLVSEPDRGDLAALYSIQASLSGHDGDFHAALWAINRAIDLWMEDMPASYMLPAGYSQRGQIQDALGNHSDATNDLQRALALFRQNHDSDSQAYYLTEIAYAHAVSSAGSKNEASNIESEAKASLSRLREHPCANCTISAQSFQ